MGEKDLLGKKINYYPNRSTFFANSEAQTNPIKMEVVGFSDKVNLLGITIPYQIVEDLNNKYSDGNPGSYLDLFVEVDSFGEVPKIAEEIEKLGYSTEYYQKDMEELSGQLARLSVSLGVISAIIFLLAGITIVSNFLASIIERKREIGLFRAIGATKFHIKKLILLEAGLMGLTGSLLGLFAGMLTGYFLNQSVLSKFASLAFTPDSIFQFSPLSITEIILFGVLLSLAAAYIPAVKAAKMNPFQALK
jgi:ABC-type antimicrobial peptide transport system permease subunit